MDFEEIISQLLQYHEAVTIAGLGTLITETVPASIHPVQHTFQPPHKKITLDTSPVPEAHLLLQAVMHVYSCPPAAAEETIRRFSDHVHERLASDGFFELAGIGRFYFDVEKKLQFTSLEENNFLLTAYGLPSFESQPVLHPENVASYAAAPPPPPKKKKRRWYFGW